MKIFSKLRHLAYPDGICLLGMEKGMKGKLKKVKEDTELWATKPTRLKRYKGPMNFVT